MNLLIIQLSARQLLDGIAKSLQGTVALVFKHLHAHYLLFSCNTGMGYQNEVYDRTALLNLVEKFNNDNSNDFVLYNADNYALAIMSKFCLKAQTSAKPRAVSDMF
jgi:hypothetical protein